jgi:peptidyl-prolyl cis-trans isomerase D
MLKYFRNRKSLGWLVGAGLLLLVILAFVVFYIPDFLSPKGRAGTSGAVAWVEGKPISSQEFLRSYQAQENQYRQQLGAQYSPELMKQLGFDNLVLRQLVQNKILLFEAERQGIIVTDAEVSKYILSDPTFQNQGKFIGREAYLNMLSRVSMSASEFEEQLRQDLMRQKLQSLVTDGVVVSGTDIEEEYRRRNEKVKLEYLTVAKSDFESDVKVSDEEARSFYDQNSKMFARPVQRKVRFITLTPQLFSSSVTVSDREIKRYYDENSYQYSTPDQVKASHILFKTGPDKDEQAVRQKAEEVLAQAKAGADFAELAKKYSEDTSAEKGGDLGFFSRGRMVPEFEEAAFSLPEGAVSDLVRTTYGFHIIKVTAHQAAFTRPLESVKEEIRSTLTQQKAQEEMDKAVTSASEKLRASGSVDALSAQYPLLVPQETAFFGKQDTLPQLGNSPDASRVAFETEVGKVSSPVRLASGYAFLQVLQERPAGVPDFDEVKTEAIDKLRNQRLMDMAKKKAEEMRAELVAQGAEKAGITLQSTESFFRGTQLPEAGRSAAVQARAFDLPVGELSEPLPADNGYVVIRVDEKSGFTQSEFDQQRPSFEEQVTSEQRLRVWNAFVASLTERSAVRVDWEVIRSVTG